MHIDDLLGKFEGCRWDSDGYLVRCPSHADGDPSLKIFIGEDRKVRMTCRAGCDTGQVVEDAGLRWSDLFDVTGDVDTVPAEPPSPAGADALSELAKYADATAERLQDSSGESEHARSYAFDRFGIDAGTAAELRLGLDFCDVSSVFAYRSRSFTNYPRLTVPLNDFSGEPRGLQGRDFSGKCPARWVSLTNPTGQAWQRWGYMAGGGGYDAVIVAEGPGDGLTAVALGYDAVVIRGAALAGSESVLEALAEGLAGRQVIAAGDGDSAGAAFNRRLAEGLRPHGINVAELQIPDHGPKTDITKWREADPESFAATFHASVRSAKPVAVNREAAEAERSAEVAVLTGAEEVTKDQGEAVALIISKVTAQYGPTDAMRAHALVAAAGGRIRYAEGLGYHVWNGRVWEPNHKKVRQAIHHMGAALMMAGRERDAYGFGQTREIDALLKELPAVPGVHVDASDFDSQRHLLSFANGTVDLRSGEMHPHRKEDMITSFIPLDFDADATCPRWESFLAEIFPGHPDLVSYMHRLIGYGITGNTSEQCFAVLWGGGANGKSVLTDTLTSVFEPMVTTTPFATFETKSGGGGIPNDLAALRGARLVMASEGESGKPMSEAVLKRLTGKDAITARFLNKEFFTYSPTFLIMLATNHKPSFRGQDEGLWRRVKLVPFLRYFAPDERDYELTERLLSEAPGIIAWAVRGAVAWYSGGLADPAEITSATREYRQTSDALSGFYSEDPNDTLAVLVASPGETMLGSDAFNDYLDWCESENLPQKERWTKRAFFSAMEERGAYKKRVAKGIALVNVARAQRPEVYDDDPEMFSEGG